MISFVSLDFEWHAVTQYMGSTPKSSNCVNMIQSCRICGVYNDNIPLELYIKIDDMIDLQRSVILQDEKIKEAKERCVQELDLMNGNLMLEPISINKIPQRKLIKKKYKLNVVKEEVINSIHLPSNEYTPNGGRSDNKKNSSSSLILFAIS